MHINMHILTSSDLRARLVHRLFSRAKDLQAKPLNLHHYTEPTNITLQTVLVYSVLTSHSQLKSQNPTKTEFLLSSKTEFM